MERHGAPHLVCRVLVLHVLLYFFMIDFQNTMCAQTLLWRKEGEAGVRKVDEGNLFLASMGATPATFVIGWVLLGTSYTVLILLVPYTWVYTGVACSLAILGSWCHHFAACGWSWDKRAICLSDDVKGFASQLTEDDPDVRAERDVEQTGHIFVGGDHTFVDWVVAVLSLISVVGSWTLLTIILVMYIRRTKKARR